MAVPVVRIKSTIPKPRESREHHIWPGTHEQGVHAPKECYLINTPSHKMKSQEELLMLPARPENTYPEVEESFRMLREAYEQALLTAYENSSFENQGRLEMTRATKERLAPAAAAQAFLSLVDKAS